MNARRDIKPDLAGYRQIQEEVEICQKYGHDYRNDRGVKGEVLSRLHPKSLQMTVSEIIEENAHTKTLRLVSRGRVLPPFLPGQYLNLAVEIDGICTGRAYSISSSPTQTAYYDLSIGRVANGLVSNYLLDEIRVGDSLTAVGPLGNFYYNPLFHGKRLVFLAGGTGITPFMSMIRTFTDRNADLKLLLIYGCRCRRDALFLPELEQRARLHPHFKYELVLSEPDAGDTGRTGWIDAGLIRELAGDPAEATFYMCGSSAMQKFCTGELESLGVKRRSIRKETFTAPGDVLADPAWPQGMRPEQPVTLTVQQPDGGAVIISSRAGEPVLAALERYGLAVPNGCRTGECSLCRIRMISGQVFQPPGALVRQSDRRLGFIHSCQAYPLTDLTLSI